MDSEPSWKKRERELIEGYRNFEAQQRALGVLWKDIISITEWVMDRLAAAEQRAETAELLSKEGE